MSVIVLWTRATGPGHILLSDSQMLDQLVQSDSHTCLWSTVPNSLRTGSERVEESGDGNEIDLLGLQMKMRPANQPQGVCR